jgi:microcystin-dependent protein
MPKNKVSEWSSTPSNNTDIGGINIAEGCAPSGINNAIRELMAQVKDMQTGTDADNFVVGGNLSVTGTTALTGSATAPTPSTSDDSTKIATTAFVRDIIPSGVIVMWSGSIASIPSGWYLCDGTNSTPDLRNKFIIAANADDAGVAKTNITGSATQTGGSKDAIVVSHTHTVTDSGHTHTASVPYSSSNTLYSGGGADSFGRGPSTLTTNSSTTGISINTTGSSGTNANLPPYYALAFIMKS